MLRIKKRDIKKALKAGAKAGAMSIVVQLSRQKSKVFIMN